MFAGPRGRRRYRREARDGARDARAVAPSRFPRHEHHGMRNSSGQTAIGRTEQRPTAWRRGRDPRRFSRLAGALQSTRHREPTPEGSGPRLASSVGDHAVSFSIWRPRKCQSSGSLEAPRDQAYDGSDLVKLITAHRILIGTAIVFFIFFSLWELRNYLQLSNTWAAARSILYLFVAAGFGIYFKFLKRWYG